MPLLLTRICQRAVYSELTTHNFTDAAKRDVNSVEDDQLMTLVALIMTIKIVTTLVCREYSRPCSNYMHSVSQKSKNPPWGYLNSSISHKRLKDFNRFFTHLLYVPMYARLEIFVHLSPTLTKLCYIKRDYLVHIMCAKCPKRAKTRAFRRLRKSLIALLIVVCGKSL